ncbi:MAG: 30S ribosomal protein S6 [Candidatus Magasanikbacteria bacterium]|nr:30S ribosomal protein S6 [Candidatus Magasanikbacteria bacterium]
MQNYELLFILPGTMGEDETAPVIEKVKQLVANNGGADLALEPLEKKRLAYPMKHIRYGYFYLAFFRAEPSATAKIQTELRLMPELLRSLVGKFNPEKQKQRRIEFGQVLASGAEISRPSVGIEAVSMGVGAEQPVVTVAQPVKEVVLEDAMEEKATMKKIKKPVDLDEIDKKLDEILDLDLGSV